MTELYKIGIAKLQEQLADLKRNYVNFVTKNPEAVNQVERTVKTASYLVEALSSNYETSIFISELVTSACNLFTYVNSRVLSKSKKFLSQANDSQIVEKIKQLLLVIEVSQVSYVDKPLYHHTTKTPAFIEISTGRIGGTGAKWAVIVIICLIKALLKCLLIFLFQTGIQTNSVVSLLQAKSSAKSTKVESDEVNEPEVVYIGSRTGHRMRTLASLNTPPNPSFPSTSDTASPFPNLPPTALTSTEKIGECLHAIRPLLHVMATGVCKSDSFIPWLVALVTDASSHVLLQRPPQSSRSTLSQFNQSERHELRRRNINILYYLLRSPMYSKYTEAKLMKLFASLSKNVPLARFMFDPLAKYMPEWQKIYFYTWTD